MDLLRKSILLQNMPKLSLLVLLGLLLITNVTAQTIITDNCSIKDPKDRQTWSEHYSRLNYSELQWYLMYSGPLSFEHLPYTRCLENTTAKFDIAILGIPFDNKVSYRTGARFGPYGIRAGSRTHEYDKGYSIFWDGSPYDGVVALDCGDVPLNPFDTKLAAQQAELAYYTLLQRERPSYARRLPNIMALGGDHFVTLPILRALYRVYGEKITVIHFDAHVDTWAPSETDPNALTDEASVDHGTFFWVAHKENLLTDRNIHVGLRSTMVNTTADKEVGFSHITAYDFNTRNITDIVCDIERRIGYDKTKPVYISIDIDVLDPAFAPGTGTPESGGLTPRELKQILKGIHDKGYNIVGADVVEVSPPYDHAEITGFAAAEVARDLLYLLRDSVLRPPATRDEL